MKPSLSLLVREAHFLADRILGLTLVDPDGQDLPAWTPGAHIDVLLPSGATRSYSLCGNPGVRGEYHIAVLREPNGRGGSAEIHDVQLVGKRLAISIPRNTFALVPAGHYVFIAGGIGITPLLPMIRQAISDGATWELHYLGRSRSTMAFRPALSALASEANAAPGRAMLDIIATDEGRRLDVRRCMTSAPVGAAIYCCGPEKLLHAVEQVTSPAHTVHLERFGRPTLAPLPGDAMVTAESEGSLDPSDAHLSSEDASSCDPDGGFDVVMQRSGTTVHVPPGQSILEVVRQTRRDLTFSCSSGYCGTCETRVLAGVPDHRDEVLSDDERASNTSMMICVSRSCRSKIVLDL